MMLEDAMTRARRSARIYLAAYAAKFEAKAKEAEAKAATVAVPKAKESQAVMLSLFAQAVSVGSIGQLVLVLIVVAAIIAVLMVILHQTGVVIPPFIITILWIVLAAVIGCVAVKFLLTLL